MTRLARFGIAALVGLALTSDGFAQGRGFGGFGGAGGAGGYRPSVNIGPSGINVGPSYGSGYTNPGYYNPGYNQGYYGPGAYNPNGYYPNNNYYQRNYPSTYATTPSTTYVPGQAVATAPTPTPQDRAVMNVQVPANAKLFFGDREATGQSGPTRQFVSPPLEAGHAYQYQLRAQWTENGQTVDRTRSVTIHPGDRVTVDFMQGS